MIKKERVAAKIFRDITWHFTGKDNELFLTFDDGPNPNITAWVLAELKEFNAKATFFCLGKNVEKYPKLYQQILDEGHSVGNHGYLHLKGWKTSNEKYIQNVQKSAQIINSKLFRPPYGKIRPKQLSYLKQEFNIVMWDVLTQDYEIKENEEKCFQNIIDYAESGSIIVFHDIPKAEKNLKYVLPKVLKHYSENGFVFNPIEFKS
ncbi:polysaccharide deacetylase family protein [Bacteroidota bacterium]